MNSLSGTVYTNYMFVERVEEKMEVWKKSGFYRTL